MNLRVLTAGCSAVVISMLIGSCGGTGATDEATSPSTTSGVEVGIEPRFADPGPYAVGVTTLTMADSRLVEVYYPVTKASAEGAPRPPIFRPIRSHPMSWRGCRPCLQEPT